MTGLGRISVLLAAVAALFGSGCPIKQTRLPRGTIVPMAELRHNAGRLPDFIAGELRANHPRRAFFALELYKTRSFADQKLAASLPDDGRGVDSPDLRKLLYAMLQPETDGSDRALVLSQVGPSLKSEEHTNDDQLWRYLELFEKRTTPKRSGELAVPYGYAARRSYGVTTFEEASRLFSAHQLFLSYLIDGKQVYVFSIWQRKLGLHRLAIDTDTLHQRINALHEQLSHRPADGDDGWKRAATELYRDLLGPVDAMVADAQTSGLLISPDGFIGNVPFGVLLRRGKLLLAARMVSYLPSASIYRAVLDHPLTREVPRVLAIGNPTYPKGVPPLVNAEEEAVTVSELFGDATLLRGDQATETAVKRLASKYNMLHFATHGVLLGRAVPDGSSLLLADGDGNDGLLTAGEIARLDLSGCNVAVLSACETSLQEDDVSSGELGSISSAFLAAGTIAVIGSLWKVDDAGTSQLMIWFYERYPELGPGQALRQARLKLSRDPRWSHPYYWGAFVLYGWEK